jgi:hypothetical protein
VQQHGLHETSAIMDNGRQLVNQVYFIELVGDLDIDLAVTSAGRVKRDEGQDYHHQDDDAESVDKKTSRVVHYTGFSP